MPIGSASFSCLSRRLRTLFLSGAACVFIAGLTFSVSSFAERTPFGDRVYQSVERALAWIRVNTRAGNFNNWSTPLGGLALMEQRVSPNLESKRRGYRDAPAGDKTILTNMVAFLINYDPALRNEGGAYAYGTGLSVAFLSHFIRTGGPQQVGARVTVSQAIINGVSRLKERQGFQPDACNDGAWSLRAPTAAGDLNATQYAMLGLSAAENIVPEATATLNEAESFIDRTVTEDGGHQYIGCGDRDATTAMTSAAINAYRQLGVTIEDARVQNALSWLIDHTLPTNAILGDNQSYYASLWMTSRALTLASERLAVAGDEMFLYGERIGGTRSSIVDGYSEEVVGWRYDTHYWLTQTQLEDGSWLCDDDTDCIRVSDAVAFSALTLTGSLGGMCADVFYDQDGVCQGRDNCPLIANPDQGDLDEDGVGDACDLCPNEPDPSQDDVDGDLIGDQCDPFVCDDISPEECDGLDNDCDGGVDEEVFEGMSDCETGAEGLCLQGRRRCLRGFSICEPTSIPTLERCDTLDNDCDGDVDENDPEGNQICETGAQGICNLGYTRCTNSSLTCLQSLSAFDELCDGLDSDCDGLVDEGNPGGDQACETENVGACREGRTRCVNGGLICARAIEPGLELCDRLDNDCDGQTDEGNPGAGQRCDIPDQLGLCILGETICAEGVLRCTSVQDGPLDEVCDGQDNDCDGVTDEEVAALNGQGPQIGEVCETACGQGVISCALGNLRCDGPGQEAGLPEVCDGLDNDCDGVVDEGQDDLGLACSTGLRGVCLAGQLKCIEGQISCVPAVDIETQQASEERCDTLDNDCDGVIDESTPGDGLTCLLDRLGQCALGVNACQDGGRVCAPLFDERPEICDGADNDCDGVVDETLLEVGQPCEISNQGVCARGVQQCVNGERRCQQLSTPQPEICDDQDNDCDGQTDEGDLGLNGQCDTELSGICAQGELRCAQGQAVCAQISFPTDGLDECDGEDNDCDGQIDEAEPQIGRRCESDDLGVCAIGRYLCIAGLLECTPDIQPDDERCDTLDNDCDGSTDEENPGGNLACRIPGERGVCSVGLTICQEGFTTCIGGVEPMNERCDGLDNDCDGLVDEGAVLADSSCDTGRFGICAQGSWVCEQGGTTCQEVVRPVLERCDGLDNDCDGMVDEGELVEPTLCSTGLTGRCARGFNRCQMGSVICDLERAPELEETCNEEDDDCDGSIDEEMRTACGLCEEVPSERCNGLDEDCDGSIDEGDALCATSQICTLGQCADLCQGTECPNPSDICVDGGCVNECEITECPFGFQCRGGLCHDLCEGVSCVNGEVCSQGECVADTCYETGCEAGLVCLQNECLLDVCAALECSEGQGCRLQEPSEGVFEPECFSSCAEIACPLGQRCSDGQCVSDACATVECPDGQICEEGLCRRDPCVGVLCGSGRLCLFGACQDDPCAYVTCSRGERCDIQAGLAECISGWLSASMPPEGGEEAGAEAGGEEPESEGGQAPDSGAPLGGAAPPESTLSDFGVIPDPLLPEEEAPEMSVEEVGCQSAPLDKRPTIPLSQVLCICLFFGVRQLRRRAS